MADTPRDISTIAQLRTLATELVASLEPGQVIALVGDLGAGKTTFVKLVASACGIGEDQVISPTFVYEQTYQLPHAIRVIERLVHLDLYRLKSDHDVVDLGLTTHDDHGVLLVEWPEHASDLLARAHRVLTFAIGPRGTRTVETGSL